jgi:hypothetical protein
MGSKTKNDCAGKVESHQSESMKAEESQPLQGATKNN